MWLNLVPWEWHTLQPALLIHGPSCERDWMQLLLFNGWWYNFFKNTSNCYFLMDDCVTFFKTIFYFCCWFMWWENLYRKPKLVRTLPKRGGMHGPNPLRGGCIVQRRAAPDHRYTKSPHLMHIRWVVGSIKCETARWPAR